MNTRMLVVVFAGQEAAAIQGLPALLATARAERRQVRLAYFHALPPARVDRYDRMVTDSDREMTRITETTTGQLTAAIRRLSLDPVELVVRFGAPGREVVRETDVFTPDLVAFFTPPLAAPIARLRAWALRRRVAHRQARLLLVETPRGRHLQSAPALALS
jgi:hypothetical protein